jgi:hypothetical protein
VLTAALCTCRGGVPLTLPGTLTALAPRGDTVLASRPRGRVNGIRLGFRGAEVTLGTGDPWPTNCEPSAPARARSLTSRRS